MALEQSIKNLLLTGPPGCGKTTVMRCLVERLDDLRLAGFFTQEIREQGQRVGFAAVSLSGRRALLAHVRSRSRQRVGRYGVEPEHLAPLVQEELVGAGEVDVYLIDEVGKMELFCPAFVEVVPRLLDGAVPIVLTVAQKGQGLIGQVKARPDVRLVTVTEANRDGLPEELERRVRDRLRSRWRLTRQAGKHRSLQDLRDGRHRPGWSGCFHTRFYAISSHPTFARKTSAQLPQILCKPRKFRGFSQVYKTARTCLQMGPEVCKPRKYRGFLPFSAGLPALLLTGLL